MLPKKEYDEIRSELNCKNPLFLMHDDPDGLSSFLLLYQSVRKGSWGLVKTTPLVDKSYLSLVKEHAPDKIFIVDIAVVEQEFIDQAGVPVIWIDHHTPLKRENVKYFNPRIHRKDAYYPATHVCYHSTRHDMWIAMVGCVGDWFLPEFAREFSRQYPDLLDEGVNNPDDAMFRSRIGELVRIFSFVLKGKTSDAMKSVQAMTRIKNPYEILKQTTPEGKYLYSRYDKFNRKYKKLISAALQSVSSDKLFVFRYGRQTSFSSDLANEVLYRNPDKFVIIGREKDDEVRMSLRARNTPVLPKLKKALQGIEGYGGGHEYACGASVKKKDFGKFLERIREQL